MRVLIVSESASAFKRTAEFISEYLTLRGWGPELTFIQPNRLNLLGNPDLVVFDLQPGLDHARLVRVAKDTEAEILCFYPVVSPGVSQAVKAAGALGCHNVADYMANDRHSVITFLQQTLAAFEPTFCV